MTRPFLSAKAVACETRRRPGKVDLMFHISHLLNLRADERSLFFVQMLNKSTMLQPLKVGMSFFGKYSGSQMKRMQNSKSTLHGLIKRDSVSACSCDVCVGV